MEKKYFSRPDIEKMLIQISNWISDNSIIIDHIAIRKNPYSNYVAEVFYFISPVEAGIAEDKRI